MNKAKIEREYGEVIWTDKPHNFLGLSINFTRYIITNRKLITRKGLFNLKEDEVELYRVMDKKAEFPLTQRIFGCGTVILHAKDSDSPTKELKSVKNPREVLRILDSTIDGLRDKYGVKGREMYGALRGVEHDDCGFADTDGDGLPDETEDSEDEV